MIFGIVALAATGFGVLAYRAQMQADAQRARAVQAEVAAVAQRDEALHQRNAALVSQSRYLAKSADELVTAGTARAAIALLRAALPDPAKGDDRPLVTEAIASAYNALYHNRERGRMAMPADATAVASDGAGTEIIIAAPDKIYVRNGLDPAKERVLAHDFGRAARLVLAPGGERLAMIAPDGTIAVRELATNKELLRHAGEGAGTNVYFMRGADLLLASDGNQHVWHLFDVKSGRELATRRFGEKPGAAVVPLIDAAHDLLVLVADDQVRRLSLDDLSDVAQSKLEHADQFAMASSPDGNAIYVAAAKGLLDGNYLILDPQTLAVQRTFGSLVGGVARFLAVSSDGKVLALHGRIGLDFVEIATGARVHVVERGEAVRGKFLKPWDYIAYGPNGFVRRYSPLLGIELASYRTIDTGSIEQIDVLGDGRGFLTLSDRPSVTSWTFDAQGISREYAVPLVIAGKDTGKPTPIEASFVPYLRSEMLAAYAGFHEVRRWNLETGEMRLVRSKNPHSEPVEQLASVASGTVVVATKSGRLEIYADRPGDGPPAAELAAEPWAYLGELDTARVLGVSKAGAATVIDVSSPAQPKLVPVPALGSCVAQWSLPGLGVCVGADGTFRMIDGAGSLIADWPKESPVSWHYAFASTDRKLMAMNYANGDLVLRTIPDGRTVRRLKLTMKFSGAQLRLVAQSPVLSDEDRAKIRAGATELEVPAGANRLSISQDTRYLAAAMPNRTIKVVDLGSGEIREMDTGIEGIADAIVFSPSGHLLAAVERGGSSALNVYEVATGQRIASIPLTYQGGPKLARLSSGHGFAALDPTGRIVVDPIFDNPRDLIAYLAREFPEGLTPAQRRAYFVE